MTGKRTIARKYKKKASKTKTKEEKKEPTYSIDVSYFMDNVVEQKEYDEFFEEFKGKINWYASDCGPFGSNERIYRSNGYLVDDVKVLLDLVKKVKGHDKFFIDFVSKTPDRIWSRNKPVENFHSEIEEENEIYSILSS